MTDSLKCFRKLGVKWHPDIGTATETDGTIASPWPGLHFLVLSGARVCLPVGYRSDGRLSLSRLLPGSPPSVWNWKGCSPGSLQKQNSCISLMIQFTTVFLQALVYQNFSSTTWLALHLVNHAKVNAVMFTLFGKRMLAKQNLIVQLHLSSQVYFQNIFPRLVEVKLRFWMWACGRLVGAFVHKEHKEAVQGMPTTWGLQCKWTSRRRKSVARRPAPA